MKVLIACEFSGIVRDAFKAKGHDAWSCDLLPTERQGQHIQDDVRNHLKGGWDLMIGHPPCTFLCNSGVSWLYKQPSRMLELSLATQFFYVLWNASIPRICIENPIPHKYGRLPKHSHIIQPWMFGHPEQKATCLWLKGLPKLKPTNNVKEQMLKLPDNKRQRLHYLPPSKDRQTIRSRTFQGIANAMAEQWGTTARADENKGA